MATLSRSDEIDLAREGDFRLGKLLVRPAVRRVECGADAATVEPRIMQVLVALAHAGGDVVSRDELLRRCWNGRFVGEGAIDRAVSLLRSLAAGPCGGAFSVETIKKVGFRLEVRETADDRPKVGDFAGAGGVHALADRVTSIEPPSIDQAPRIPRRAMIAAMLVGGTLLGVGAVRLARRHVPPAQAVALYNKGMEAQRQGLPDQTEQAIAFLREAVKLDPDYADAWGALALSYRHKLENDPVFDQRVVAGWIEGAAGRALALDPDNADAHVARAMIRPNFRNWASLERTFRDALRRYPDHWLLRGTTGRLMYDVGRWKAGVPLFEANVRDDPFLPVSRVMLAEGLWGAGRPQEADVLLQDARGRWPRHPMIWQTQLRFLAFTGRAQAALDMVLDTDGRPPVLSDDRIARDALWVGALRSLDPGETARAAAALTALALQNVQVTGFVVPILMALDRPEEIAQLLERYYFGTAVAGAAAVPMTRLTRRDTGFLFAPAPVRPVAGDSRVAPILRRIELEKYWRDTGNGPDMRA